MHMRTIPSRSVTTHRPSLLGRFAAKKQAFTKAYGSKWSPTKLLWLPGYKSLWKAQRFHTYRALEPLWSGRQCSPGSASTALHGGWILRVPQNLGARCAIFVSRADLRTRSLALQYRRKAESIYGRWMPSKWLLSNTIATRDGEGAFASITNTKGEKYNRN